MKKPHKIRQPHTAEQNTMVLESSMDEFARLQEHQRDFLDWLKGHEESSEQSAKAFEAIR